MLAGGMSGPTSHVANLEGEQSDQSSRFPWRFAVVSFPSSSRDFNQTEEIDVHTPEGHQERTSMIADVSNEPGATLTTVLELMFDLITSESET